jgi:hypothetical protein
LDRTLRENAAAVFACGNALRQSQDHDHEG